MTLGYHPGQEFRLTLNGSRAGAVWNVTLLPREA